MCDLGQWGRLACPNAGFRLSQQGVRQRNGRFKGSNFKGVVSGRSGDIAKVYEEASHTVCDRTKAHTARWLGLNDTLAALLLEHRSQTKFSKPSDYLIVNKDGEIIWERVIRRIHDRVCKAAELKRIRIHDLQHTYSSHYIMNGGDSLLVPRARLELARQYDPSQDFKTPRWGFVNS